MAAAEIEPAFSLFIRLAAIAGGRRGELHAIRFTDIDTARNTIELVGQEPQALARIRQPRTRVQRTEDRLNGATTGRPVRCVSYWRRPRSPS
ncbi:MAG: hypothetical protein ACRDY7_05435 [Acidimicrobiia bacterium]